MVTWAFGEGAHQAARGISTPDSEMFGFCH